MLFLKQPLFVLSIWALGIFNGILLNVEWSSAQPPPPTRAPLPVKFHEDHRLIQWCVNGVDEPEFDQYPFSEFKPFLQRKYYAHYKANERFGYEVDMWPIKNSEPSIGSGGTLYQRAHFVFKSKIRRKFEYDVFTAHNDTKIEGLLVQANYAPLGVGLPTGEFVHPSHFNCDDCEKPIGIPIGCRKRTYMHVVHPTLLAFHHKMRIPQNEQRRRQQRCLDQLIPRQCLVDRLEEARVPDVTTTPPPGMDPPAPPPPLAWPNLKYGQPLPSTDATCNTDSDCEGQFRAWYQNHCCSGPPDTPSGTPGMGGMESACKDHWKPATDPPGGTPPVAPVTPDPADERILHPDCPEFLKMQPDPMNQTHPKFVCKPYIVNICLPPPGPESNTVPKPWISGDDLRVTGLCPDPTPGTPEFDRYKTEDQCCVDWWRYNVSTTAEATCRNTRSTVPVPPAPSKLCDRDCGSGATTGPPLRCTQVMTLPYWPVVDNVQKPPNHAPIPSIEYPEPPYQPCSDIGNEKEFGKTSEVHGNFVWYFPPCHYSARIRFLLLIVHSFQRGIYSIIESEDYYDLKSAAQNSQQGTVNSAIPSPLFTGFPHKCEGSGNTDSLYSKTFQEETFDYSRSYDECVQTIGGNKTQMCPGVPKFKPDDGSSSSSGGRPPRRGRKPTGQPKFSDAPFPKCQEKLVPPTDPIVKCEHVCPGLPVTTDISVTTERVGFIKRSAHGGINIVTNFCIMPICIFVARFYKETFNYLSFKGQKEWYWMHMLGAGGSTVLMYMGYFSRRYVELNEHVVLGDVYIICLGISYVTAWIRHKRKMISMIVEVAHTGCGYACFFLALRCVGNAKYPHQSNGQAVALVVYVASASLIVFYLGMTVHICSLDQKFGMKPRRLHFPTVEARFDDLPVPGRNVRKAFLIVLLCVNLPLTLATLVL
ncbi:hypothetical protein Ocin01_09060 [Orchesella cincta]|uniref:Uncharacterized protein n=1 Tax=Orchesella cincta TaxID=48709 RepID=A0A1D2MX54_ORCCI|nr:hypothetical protein Ocin01_09060 [Orchesella cincta]